MSKIHEKIAAKQGVAVRLSQKVTTLEQTLVTYEQALERHKEDRDRILAQVEAMQGIAQEAEDAGQELEKVKARMAEITTEYMSKPWVPNQLGIDEDPEFKELAAKKVSLLDIVDGAEKRVNTVYYGKAGL